MHFFIQLLIGAFMIGFTVMVHAVALDYIIRHARKSEDFFRLFTTTLWRPCLSAYIVIMVFCIHILNIWSWALLYLVLDSVALHDFSEALYFSTVTYTTVGYGDIVLDPSSRMLSGIEAANGVILFGWTTAFIFEVISQLYRRETKSL